MAIFQPRCDETFNIIGWNSSYTGEPIPTAEMHEWVENACGRILSGSVKRVLEIGCGTGLLLYRIAPHCEQYVATDFSETALQQLRRTVSLRPELSHVRFYRRMADDFEGIDERHYDTVILNSVVQYFPNAEYLMQVLEGAIGAVADGGRVFLGDVRSLRLLEAFHASVQLQKAPANLSINELRERVNRQVGQERELVIDAGFFRALKGRLSAITHVEILPKRGRGNNELTKFRYDVILHTGYSPSVTLASRWLSWRALKLSLAGLRLFLEDLKPESFGIVGVPNARVSHDLLSLQALRVADYSETVATLRDRLSQLDQPNAVDPEVLCSAFSDLPYAIDISWPGADATFDVLFRKRGDVFNGAPAFPETVSTNYSWRGYTNDPLQSILSHEFGPQLRQYLGDRLPGHMVPSAFVMIEHIPTSRNGKLDRRALPVPERKGLDSRQSFVAPETPLEITLAEIWAKVLGLEKVDVNENFFDLGGHSILGIRLCSEMKDKIGIDLPVRYVFESPTIAKFAVRIECERKGTKSFGPADEKRWFFLFELRPGTGKIPVFLLPGGIGGDYEFLVYARMVHYIPSEHPVYGLRARSADGIQPAHASVEEMASDYLKEMKSLQPSGPYYLIGNCIGGFVAYEIARQLKTQGEEVAMLALMDTLRMSRIEYLLRRCRRLLEWCWPKLGLRTWWENNYYITRIHYHWAQQKRLGRGGKLFYLLGKTRVLVADLSKGSVRNGEPTVDNKSQPIQVPNRIQRGYIETIFRYRPKPYEGRVSFIVNEEFHRRDPMLGWANLVSGEIEVYKAQGNHDEYIRDHVEAVGKLLKDCLDKAERRNVQSSASPAGGNFDSASVPKL